jgi:hypothetical protein
MFEGCDPLKTYLCWGAPNINGVMKMTDTMKKEERKIMVCDWNPEKGKILCTVAGTNTIEYTPEEFINCKHIDDYPDYEYFTVGNPSEWSY